MTNRQARIKRLKEAFQKAEELMNEGYIVQWDGEVVTRLDLSDGVTCWASANCASVVYSESDEGWNNLLDMKISEINAELKERLTVWKKVDVKI